MSVLSDEIDNDPTGKGYADLIENAPGKVVELLNANTETMKKPRMITSLTILAECAFPIGFTALSKLRAVDPKPEPLFTAMYWLDRAEGLDIGNPRTQAQLDIHATVDNYITQEEADELKNLAIQPASRAEVLGLPYMTEELLRNR